MSCFAIIVSRRSQWHVVMMPRYANAWTKVTSEDPTQIATGNQRLLAIEQFTIIQPLYDAIKNEPLEAGVFSSTRPFTANIHPYHLDFITAMLGKDVTNVDDRWAWITQPGGMWEKWVIMPATERRRLVNLSLDDIIAQRWTADGGMLIPSLLPPGSP